MAGQNVNLGDLEHHRLLLANVLDGAAPRFYPDTWAALETSGERATSALARLDRRHAPP
jgi:hypothetical protein